jgi:hypothetical protein
VAVGEPADRDLVVTALRLGWTLAEVRGRNRLYPPPIDTSSFPRGDHALPLRYERSAPEQNIEAQVVVSYLAKRLEVDNPLGQPTSYPTALAQTLQALADARPKGGKDADDAWDNLAELIYHWDADIQDRLSAVSDSQNMGYQLGRGLSESYWALDGATASSWKVLLVGLVR